MMKPTRLFAATSLSLVLASTLLGAQAQTPAPAAMEGSPAPAASPTLLSSATQAQERAAQVAAETWLMLLDGGKYAESWQTAASPFQSAIAQDKWTGQLDMVRTAFGKASGRKLRVIKYTTTIERAAPGEYVILQYEAAFENKSAIETLTTMLDKDHGWKVAGYYIK